jgi:hypothetical protein
MTGDADGGYSGPGRLGRMNGLATLGAGRSSMSKDWAAEHYEDASFEFPLWTLIQKRAEEKDISYLDAALEVAPEYAKGIRIKDVAYEDEQVDKRVRYLQEQFGEGQEDTQGASGENGR